MIVSDITWRDQPGPLGSEWRWVADATRTTTDEYLAELNSAVLLVSRVTMHGRDAWDEYWQPMLTAAGQRSATANLSFIDDVERNVAVERRAEDAWLDYTTFTTVKYQ